MLDNFEHVVAAASFVGAVLATCPRLKVLVTSRLLLRIDGEHALPVPPLAAPDPESAPSIAALRQSAAVRLFAQRGQAILPSFALTDDNAALVADICRRLDGVPLAVELAAARINHLSLPMLRERLDRRLPLLTNGGRDRPPRLQTMRGAIDWSHQLLAADEQALFRRLAVFAGGCTLEAAESVAADDVAAREVNRAGGEEWSSATGEDGAVIRVHGERRGPARSGAAASPQRMPPNDATPPVPGRASPRSTLDVIAALVDASLLHADTGRDEPARYRMLETIRDFAQERLAASGEEERVRSRHAAWFLAFAEEHELAELLPGADRALARLDAEQPNLRTALAWLEDRRDAPAFLCLAAALGRYWSDRGHYREGRGWLERALAAGDGAATAERASALVALGMIEAYQGAFPDAVAHFTDGLVFAQDRGEPFVAANALLGLGALAIAAGDEARGAALLEASIAAADAVPDKRLAGIVAARGLINLAMMSRTQGDVALATERLETAARLTRDAEYAAGTILALGDLGDLSRDRGEYERAMARYREALALGRSSPRTRVVADIVEAVGIVAAASGEAARGAGLLGAADALRERMGLRFRVQENRAALAQAVAACRAALGEPRFAAAWAAGAAMPPGEAVAAALDPGDARTGTGGGSAGGVAFTPRETEILRLLASGMTDPAIASALFISARTVENHVARIFVKLGVRTRTAAAAAAIARGTIEAAPPPSA